MAKKTDLDALETSMLRVLDLQIERDEAFSDYKKVNDSLKEAQENLLEHAKKTGFLGDKEFARGTVSVNEGSGKLELEAETKAEQKEVISKLHKKHGTTFVKIELKERKKEIKEEIEAKTKDGKWLQRLGYSILVEPSISVKPRAVQGRVKK